MIYIIGAIIWVIANILILRFFSVCKSDKYIPRHSELKNKIQANSPYNDGWTKDHYDNL